MKARHMILASDFCSHYNIELSLIESLKASDLIETIVIEEKLFIEEAELPRLEKLVRLHVELGINVEGIETILHLQDRIHEMQLQITKLKNELRRYQQE